MRFFPAWILLITSLLLLSCSPDCFYDADCPSAQKCMEGKCLVNTDSFCTNHNQCKAGQSCFKGYCVQDPLRNFRAEEVRKENTEPSDSSTEKTPEKPLENKPTENKPTENKPEQIVENKPTENKPTENKPEQVVESIPDKSKHQCLSFSACKTTEECRFNSAGILTCQTPLVNQASFGQACTKNSECKSGICDKKRKACSYVCQQNSDCPPEIGICDEVPLSSDVDETPYGSFFLCHVGGNLCEKNADCTANKACYLISYQNKKETRCREIITTRKELGLDCYKDEDCHSNVCIDSVCSQFCKETSDCKEGYDCKAHTISYSNQTFTFSMCQVSPLGIPCKKPQDCPRVDYTCLPKGDSGKVSLVCQNFRKRLKPSDDECKKHTDCMDGICLPFSKRCTSVCEKDADCPTGKTCQTSNITIDGIAGSISFCSPTLPTCEKTSECTKNTLCSPQENNESKLALVCLKPNTNNKEHGNSCLSDEDCQSLFCYNQICSESCKSNSDCLTGFSCKEIQLSKGSQNLTMKTCVVPAEGLPCKSQADCKSNPSWLCRVKEINQTLEGRCQTVASGTRKEGETCASSQDCESGTCFLPQGICSKLCWQGKDCVLPLECQKHSIQEGTSNATDLHLCTQKACQGDLDCRTGAVCKHASGYLLCEIPNAQKSVVGSSCQLDSDCQTNLCHPTLKICSSACKGGSNAYCPLQYECESTPTGSNGLHLCIPISSGCQANTECKEGKQCLMSVDAFGRPLRICMLPKGSLKIGQRCEPSMSQHCQSGVCEPNMKRCSLLCKTSQDCPTGYGCQESLLDGKWSVMVCRNCSSNRECQANEICQLEYDVNKKSSYSICKNTQGKKTGETCDSNVGFPGECQSHVCESVNQSCAKICSSHKDCSDDQRCESITVSSNISTQICQKGQRTTCHEDADCLNGTICQVNFAADGSFKQSCEKPTGDGFGTLCTPTQFPGSCSSRLCDPSSKRCTQTCKPNVGGCPQGYVCDELTVNSNKIFACLQAPQPCAKNADCAAGMVCFAELRDNVFVSYCKEKEANKKEAGVACTTGADCQTGLCHPKKKECLELCEQDSNCSLGHLCGKAFVEESLLSTCVPSNSLCDTSKTCPAKEPICSIEINVQNDIITQCTAGGPGTSKVGEKCDPNKVLPGDCENRFCDIGTQHCTQTCQVDSDCIAPLQCLSGTLVNKKVVKGCLPPQGTVCKTDSSCILEHVCKVTRATTKLLFTCEPRTGKTIGEVCDPVKPEECESRVCNPSKKVCTLVCETDSDCKNGVCETISYDGLALKACTPN